MTTDVNIGRAKEQLALLDLDHSSKAARSADLDRFSPANIGHLAFWLDSGKIPPFEYMGMSVSDIVDAIGAHPLVAIIMLDSLTKNTNSYRLIIAERDGRLVFVMRDATPTQEFPEPVASALTSTITDAVSKFFREENISPQALQLDDSLFPEPLWATIKTVASVTSKSDLEAAVQRLDKLIEKISERPEGSTENLRELERIGLVIRLIRSLADDDCRRLRESSRP